jgi:hypothetical protein
LRSLALTWRDEETGDELVVDVRGSERFLEGLRPLGFVPAAERHGTLRSSASPRQSPSDHRVHWAVRLVRHWNPQRH